MRKVKEKQKKDVSQQNKTKQLKTNQYNERRGDKRAILPPHFVFLL